MSQFIISRVVLASLVDAVDYPTPGDFFLAFNGTDTLSMDGGSNNYASNVSIYFEDIKNEIGSPYPVTVSEPGEYKAVVDICGETYLTDAVTVENVIIPLGPTNILAFHYVDFDTVYGDADVSVAATNGRVFADTPLGTYLWGTLSAVSNIS